MASVSPASSSTPDAPFTATSDRYWRRVAWTVIVLAAILFFVRLGARALWSSEFRWAEISREMVVTGNYFWPTINGRVYYDKPLGSYWLVLLATPLTDRVDETASRLPCAIAGLLAVGLLILLARRLYDLKTGALAGFILATSFSFVFFSRHASADVETLTGELAALLLFDRHRERQDGWWVVWLWIIMAFTSLTKGLLGFVLPILVIGTFCTLIDGWAGVGAGLLTGSLANRLRWIVERNRWLFNWKSIVAIAIGSIIYYAPFEVSSHMMGSQKGLEMVFRENVVRFFHPFDHRGPIYLYVYTVFALMAPWSALLPGALVEMHHQRNIEAEPAQSDRFALVYFWATFVFYTLSGSRRSYYILPILPAAALIVARVIIYQRDIASRAAKFVLKFGYGVIAAAIAASIAMLIPPHAILPGKMASFPGAPAQAAIVVFWIISLASVFYAIRKLTSTRIALSMSVIAYLAMTYVFIFAMPAAEAYRGEKPFGLQVLQVLNGNTSELALYRTLGPLFYLNPPHPLPLFERKADLEAAIAKDSIRWFIVRRRDLPALGVPTQVMFAEASFPWEDDENYRNKVMLVRVNAPPPS
jgi:4-amino-4-deoxy-L-arabinose transferase-like glycosyltransferase